MQIVTQGVILIIALLHLYFLYFEMFAWETIGKRTFKSLSPDLFKPTKALAANQGLYNGFLAAGLIWSLMIDERWWSFYVAVFFLTCVLIAGIYGALTASKKIFWVQGFPALIALIMKHIWN
jgi:putative membrane protein